MAYVAFAQSSRTLRGRVYPAHGFALRRSGTRPELRAAYEALAAVVSPFCVDGEIVTKTFWAALHGHAELERSHRIRPGMRGERITLVVRANAISGNSPPARGSCHSVE
jgi:hypothetical protein